MFTGHRVAPEEEPVYIVRLSDELGRAAGGIFVDVKVLDNAPPGFVVDVLEAGVVLIERLPGLRLHLLIRALEDYVRLTQKRKYLNEI